MAMPFLHTGRKRAPLLLETEEPMITSDFITALFYEVDERSCIRPLRITYSTPKPATMSPLHHPLRGHCHGTASRVLPTRSRGAGVRLPDALRAVAQRCRFPSPAARANHALPTQALPGTPTVCW